MRREGCVKARTRTLLVSSLPTYLRGILLYAVRVQYGSTRNFKRNIPVLFKSSTWCTTSCCRRRSVAGERMQHDCSSSRTAVEELAQGRQAHARAEAALPLAHEVEWWINNEQRSSSCSYVCRGVDKTMRVSLHSRDAVRGAVGKISACVRHLSIS